MTATSPRDRNQPPPPPPPPPLPLQWETEPSSQQAQVLGEMQPMLEPITGCSLIDMGEGHLRAALCYHHKAVAVYDIDLNATADDQGTR